VEYKIRSSIIFVNITEQNVGLINVKFPLIKSVNDVSNSISCFRQLSAEEKKDKYRKFELIYLNLHKTSK
jgi:hypothetical protein